MSEYRVLDLFCGLGGFSAAFADSDRWSVTTVDIKTRFDPDIQADVFDLRPSDFNTEFDVVLASPPCAQFSLAQNLNGAHEPDGDHIALVHHALGLIQGLRPAYWVLENPRGRLRSHIGEPTTTVTYCQYGEQRMKPTDLWGHHPPQFIGRRCGYGDDCHYNHRGGGINPESDELPHITSEEVAKVPYQLSESIRDTCERALDGEVAEQVKLGEVSHDRH